MSDKPGVYYDNTAGKVPILYVDMLDGTFAARHAAYIVGGVALPIPVGAATEATLAAIKAKTDNLDVLLSSRTKAADSQHITVDNPSIAVTVATLPLPSGAATEATLAAMSAKLPATLVGARLDVNVGNTPAVTASWAAAQHVIVDTAPVTHVIADSGTITTVTAVTAITNALPAGAAIIGKVGIDQTTPGTTNAVQANAGTNLNTSALALEAGHLSTIDTSTAKIPAQGQALAGASMPVVLPAAQQAALTPPAAITGFALDATVAKDASLTTLDTDLKARIPANGQAAMAASVPVVIASDQSPLSTVSGALTTPSEGRHAAATPGVAAQFPTLASKTVLVFADEDNVFAVSVGSSGVGLWPDADTSTRLGPGDAASFPVDNLNRLYLSSVGLSDRVRYAVLS